MAVELKRTVGEEGTCGGRKYRLLQISEWPCFPPHSLLCKGMNGMAFLERASVNIKEFLSLGGPVEAPSVLSWAYFSNPFDLAFLLS